MFLMYDLNMNEINYPEGFIPLDIFISSIDKERITDEVEGSNRKINHGSTYRERDIELSILLKANDTQDYRLLRDETYGLFNKHDTFYVVEKYQPGKRYLISIDKKFIPERMPNNQRYAEVKVETVTTELPFAESIGTTADIDKNGLRYSDELWSYGMGLSYDEETHKYSHNTKTFRIYNAGNVTVDPFEMGLKIKISGISGSSEYIELRNVTTGDVFVVNEGVNGKTVLLDGPNVTINGLQAFRRTNRKFIRIAPGQNHIEVRGASSFKVEFDFRFYYK